MNAYLTSFHEMFDLMPWTELGLLLAGGWLLFQLYRYSRSKSNTFAAVDLFVDRKGRADLYKVVVVVMAGLSVYTIMKLTERDKPVETLLLGVLAIFVGGRAATAAFSKDGSPPPEEEVGKDEKEGR